jgi:hypothetical protein
LPGPVSVHNEIFSPVFEFDEVSSPDYGKHGAERTSARKDLLKGGRVHIMDSTGSAAVAAAKKGQAIS